MWTRLAKFIDKLAEQQRERNAITRRNIEVIQNHLRSLEELKGQLEDDNAELRERLQRLQEERERLR